MKPQHYEETVRVEFQGVPLTVSLVVDTYLDENYGATIDGTLATSRMEYVFISTFVDQPPRQYTDNEVRAIVAQAQAEFIRQRNQWT